MTVQFLSGNVNENTAFQKLQLDNTNAILEIVVFQLSFANHPNEVDLRKEWRQYDYENRKFRAAIKNCKTGEKDVDCNVVDYIGNEDDFNQAIERSNTKEIELNYDDLRRNDVVERSGF